MAPHRLVPMLLLTLSLSVPVGAEGRSLQVLDVRSADGITMRLEFGVGDDGLVSLVALALRDRPECGRIEVVPADLGLFEMPRARGITVERDRDPNASCLADSPESPYPFCYDSVRISLPLETGADAGTLDLHFECRGKTGQASSVNWRYYYGADPIARRFYADVGDEPLSGRSFEAIAPAEHRRAHGRLSRLLAATSETAARQRFESLTRFLEEQGVEARRSLRPRVERALASVCSGGVVDCLDAAAIMGPEATRLALGLADSAVSAARLAISPDWLVEQLADERTDDETLHDVVELLELIVGAPRTRELCDRALARDAENSRLSLLGVVSIDEDGRALPGALERLSLLLQAESPARREDAVSVLAELLEKSPEFAAALPAEHRALLIESLLSAAIDTERQGTERDDALRTLLSVFAGHPDVCRELVAFTEPQRWYGGEVVGDTGCIAVRSLHVLELLAEGLPSAGACPALRPALDGARSRLSHITDQSLRKAVQQSLNRALGYAATDDD